MSTKDIILYNKDPCFPQLKFLFLPDRNETLDDYGLLLSPRIRGEMTKGDSGPVFNDPDLNKPCAGFQCWPA